jgi:hypothetical protein
MESKPYYCPLICPQHTEILYGEASDCGRRLRSQLRLVLLYEEDKIAYGPYAGKTLVEVVEFV